MDVSRDIDWASDWTNKHDLHLFKTLLFVFSSSEFQESENFIAVDIVVCTWI